MVTEKREKLYQELGLESLKERRWYRELIFFIKAGNYSLQITSISVFFNILDPIELSRVIKFQLSVNSYSGEQVRSPPKKNSGSISNLSFTQPFVNTIFNCHNSRFLELIPRLGLVLIHFRDHKFKHTFQDSLNPL